MSKHVNVVLILLTSAAVLLGGCRSGSSSTAMPVTAPVLAKEPTPTATATPTVVATTTPTAVATRAASPTATPAPTTTSTSPPPLAPAESSYQEGFTDQGEPFRGDPAAAVVFEEFSSYQCGFCAKYFRESFAQVIANYVETGRILYVFRDFPLASQPQSPLAAEAANCAGNTGDGSKYWAMHDLLFARQAEWSGRPNANAIFKGYAQELGLDEAVFDECLDSRATRSQAESDVAEGIARGVRGTPTFIIDGQPLVGAQPYDVIAASIDAAIDAALAGGTETDTTLELAPASALPSDLQRLQQNVQEAYRFALANPDALNVIACYCGCNKVGHKNNRMCYVQSETADGQVVFDTHAVT